MSPKNAAMVTEGIDKSKIYFPVETGQPMESTVIRDGAGVKVKPTGRGISNVAGGEALIGLAKQRGLDPKNFGAIYGGDEANGLVIAYAVPAGAEGATTLKYNPKRKTITLYMHSLFAEKPALRPEKERWCSITPGVDSEKVPCLVISLRVAPLKQKVTGGRKRPQSQPPAQG